MRENKKGRKKNSQRESPPSKNFLLPPDYRIKLNVVSVRHRGIPRRPRWELIGNIKEKPLLASPLSYDYCRRARARPRFLSLFV